MSCSTIAPAAEVGFHPIAALFPLLVGEPFEALAEDIKAHGLQEPIIEHEGLILDGRNRYRACIHVQVEPRFEQFQGADPVGFVISKNLHRRHLNEPQRAMAAAKLATLSHGQRADRPANLPVLAVTQPDAAAKLNVSERSVRDAKKVRDQGVASLVRRVEQGEVAISVASQIATLPPGDQHALAGASEAVLRGVVKRARRQRKETVLAASTAQASTSLGTTLYAVICADPPWRFEPYSRLSGMDRAADNHYPTLTIADIKAIQPPAAKDCVLFLWATAPMVPEALAVINAWGFTYKSQFIWVKDRVGTGYWARNKHEVLMIATRGDVPAPAPGEQYDSVIPASVGRHSEKPNKFFEMIQTMFPTLRRLEMFARQQRAGWDAWGNEVIPHVPTMIVDSDSEGSEPSDRPT